MEEVERRKRSRCQKKLERESIMNAAGRYDRACRTEEVRPLFLSFLSSSPSHANQPLRVALSMRSDYLMVFHPVYSVGLSEFLSNVA
jgi:hypothetical protein